MSEISVAPIGWIIRSSVQKLISRHVCNQSPNGHIVVSYETFALVRDIVVAHALPPITMKGISREVTPYAVEGMLDAAGQQIKIFSEHLTGLDFYLDPRMVHSGSAERIRALLQDAIAALEKYSRI